MMREKMEKLLWSDKSTLQLNATEERLLEFALDTFGVPLTRFLLSGLGEQCRGNAWLFTLEVATDAGIVNRKIRVESDDLPDKLSFIPRKRDPLVILALLRLLFEQHQAGVSTSKLSYQQSEVLRLLDWEDVRASERAINVAVKRYMYLDYRWSLDKAQLAARNLTYYHGSSHFISGHFRTNEKQERKMKRIANTVHFAAVFVSDLREYSLFDINWNSVREISRIIVR